MKIAVSFLSVVTIVVAVGAIAVYIVWITKECEEIGHFRCPIGNSCIPFSRLCNNHPDCPNNSDELPHECADLVGLHRQLLQHFLMSYPPPPPNTTSTSCQVDYPDGCICMPKAAVRCKELDWETVPWEEFDSNTTALTLIKALAPHGRYGWRDAAVSLKKLKLLGFYEHPFISDFPIELVHQAENLVELHIRNCSVNRFPPGVFRKMKNLTKIYVTNSSLEELEYDALSYLPMLKTIDLSENKLHLNNFSFRGLPQVYELSLRGNRLERIAEDFTRGLPALEFLDLRKNQISIIHPRAFRFNTKLFSLQLSENRIAFLFPDTFRGLTSLIQLDMGFNSLKRFSSHTFCNMNSIESLGLRGVEIENIDLEIFSCMKNLTFVHFKRFEFCRHVPSVPKCYPISNGLTSKMNLLDSAVLRLIIWVIATLTVFGNITVLVSRWWSSRQVGKVDVFINNLAVADILTGFYLITLALKDIEMRNAYSRHAYEWTTSWQCTAIGVLAMISCEVSLLILTMMSLERYLVISGPFAAPKLGRTLALSSMAIIWIFVTGLAITPLLQWKGKTSFYGSSDLCFPLHMDEPHAIGWQYSAFVFVGLNSMCLIVIATCYGKLFWVIRKTRLSTPVLIQNMEMALRFFLMVVSDFVCWAPVILLKVIVLYGFEIRQDIHAWLLIFVIPLNSAVNPFLYTFSTNSVRSQFLQQLVTAIGRINHSHRDEIHVLRHAGTVSETPLYNSVLSK